MFIKSEIKLLEVVQAGDNYLLKFNCPECNKEQFEGYPLKSCSSCDLDLSMLPINMTYNRRLLSGTKRKKQKIKKSLVIQMFNEQEGKCGYCSLDIKNNQYHVDHILPISVGGSNNLYNLVLSCAKCNLKVSSKCFSSFDAKRIYILNQYL